MSKVYSFRLNDNNPREARAKSVIDAWVDEGYSLRYVVVEALIKFQINENNYEMQIIQDTIMEFIARFDAKQITPYNLEIDNNALSNSFLKSIKSSVKSGIQAK